jgi:hypothetical protein
MGLRIGSVALGSPKQGHELMTIDFEHPGPNNGHVAQRSANMVQPSAPSTLS